jgi:hypothetical protein
MVARAMLISLRTSKEVVMQLAITALAVLGGLLFSFAISLLVEELIFGKIFRAFFAHAAAVSAKAKR